jgi:hypothetical protein
VDSSTYANGDTINDGKNKNNSSDNDLNINNKKKYINKCSNKILQSVADVLIGNFSYHVSVPDNVFELGVFGDNSSAGGFKNHKKQVYIYTCGFVDVFTCIIFSHRCLCTNLLVYMYTVIDIFIHINIHM